MFTIGHHLQFNELEQQESEMTDLDNGLLHQPIQAHLKTAHELRARYVAGLIKGLWVFMTGTKPSAGGAPASQG